MYDKTVTIIVSTIFFMVLLSAIALILCGFIDLNLLIAGSFLLAISIPMLIGVLLGKSILNYIVFSKNEVKIITVFRKIVKSKNWHDLKSINIIKLRGNNISGKYICLNFFEKKIINNLFNEIRKEENIIIIAYSRKNLDILRNFTDIPITEEEQ
jgi:hypothetical protein